MTRDASTLIISVKMISVGTKEPVDDLAPILKQASDALVRLKGPKAPGVPEQGAAASAIASVGSIIVDKIGRIADIMGEVTKVRYYVVMTRASNLIGILDPSLRKGGLGYFGPHSEGRFSVNAGSLIVIAILPLFHVGHQGPDERRR